MPVEPIGQILLRQAGLAPAALEEALARQKGEEARLRLGEALVAAGALTAEDVLRALATQWGLPFADRVDASQISRRATTALRLDYLKRRRVLPLEAKDGAGVAVMADPLDVEAFDAVANAMRLPCRRWIAPPEVIEEALTRCHYADGDAPAALLDEPGDERSGGRLAPAEDLLDIANRPPIVRLVNTIFFQAAASRASDIHIEPYERDLKVRFRIDGILHDRFSPPRQHAAALVSRLKIMASLNIAERRLPQDGRIRIRIGEKEIDVRVSTIPTSGGERVVLRLLDRSGQRLTLAEVGFAPDTERDFRRLIHAPHGMILLTGPTGSGKTTTLYAALSLLNTQEVNILTVEDPIEYQLPGVGQMQVQPKINLTFASCLRHILRQDPDVIMVGEIRDQETAEIAIQAALTGHLVLSTLHTNDSASAFTRLLDMGMEPYLVSSSVLAVMAQRLARVICAQCKEACAPSKETLSMLPGGGAGAKLYHGRGCEACLNTGFRGRTALMELLQVDEEIRDLVMARAGASVIKQAALRKRMRTLRDDGLRKALAGETTVEEVLRVAQEENGASED